MNITQDIKIQSPEAIRADFREKGYYLVKGALSRERILEVREFLLDEFNRKFPEENLDEANVIFNYPGLYPHLIDVIANERIVSALKIILGENYVLMPPASCIRNSFWDLHTDVTTMTSQGFPIGQRPDFTGVAIGTYLQDSSEQGGGMFVVPGTHKLKKDPLVRQKKLLKGIDVPLGSRLLRKLTGNRFPRYEDFSAFEKGGIDLEHEMGDTLILDMRLLHRGSKPQPGVKRTDTKLGIFNLAASWGDGSLIDYWMDYLYSPFYHASYAIREDRNFEPLKRAAEKAGFTAL